MTDHTDCCCTETLTNYRALQSAYGAASRDRDELVGLLLETTAERDRARTTATRLEAELARGFRVAAPDVTLTRTSDGAPGTPDEAVPGPSGALGRPGSENTPTDTYPPKNGPENAPESATGRP